MLFDHGIRTKLLAVLALPSLALTVVVGVSSVQAFGQADRAGQVERLAKDSLALGPLVASLQAERTASLAGMGKRPVGTELSKARAVTDLALGRSRALLAPRDVGSLSAEATEGLAVATSAVTRGHDSLRALRADVSGAQAKPADVVDRYSAIIANDISLPQRVGAALPDRSVGGQLAAYSTAQQLVELATQERQAALTAIAAAGGADPPDRVALARVATLQVQAVATFAAVATTSSTKALNQALNQPVAYGALRARVLVGAAGKVTAPQWRMASGERITALASFAAPIAAAAADRAAGAASSAHTRALGVLGAGCLLVALVVALGLVLTRIITWPLRHLADVAAKVRDDLPLMVERIVAPGDGGAVTLPEIPVGADDEVGQLAGSFRDVHATTMRVAREQAALRASIAEMFVNVARRNHVLLSRQLSLIDRLERSEHDPDAQDTLVRLHHLASRMRRGAESLLVLAGSDTGRRVRQPMPLSDVVRTAVSEIEGYHRVDLALTVDPPVLGHVALASAHLLAELVENATQFSNPDTRVVVSSAVTADGVRVTLTDRGLGMAPDEISAAGERIADPPVDRALDAARLGLNVVGRLARRLDAAVVLAPGSAGGTVVTVDLPPALFATGSVSEAAAGRHRGVELAVIDLLDDGTDLAAQPPVVATAAPALDAPQPVNPPPTWVARAAVEPAAVEPAAVEPTDVEPAVVEASFATPDQAELAVRPPTGVPAMDILPTRPGGRGLRMRRPGGRRSSAAPAAAPAPVPVPAPVRAPAPPAAAAPTWAPTRSEPSADHPTSGDWALLSEPAVSEAFVSEAFVSEASVSEPVATAPLVSEPTPAASSTDGVVAEAPNEPIAAPPSLFATAPTPDSQPAALSATTPVEVPAAERAAAQAQSLRERSATASQALSELSALTTYRPEAVRQAPDHLARRTPQATAAGQPPPPAAEEAGSPRPDRVAADVRSMLSGFQAGVQRARATPLTTTAGDEGE